METAAQGGESGGKKTVRFQVQWWRDPNARKITPISLVAFALHFLAELLVVVAFALPRWWRVTLTSDEYTDYGLWVKVACRSNVCEVSTVPSIRPGKEFLFIAIVFQCLAVALTSGGLIAHALYLPIRHHAVRDAAMYMLAASGLFLLPSCFAVLGGRGSLGGAEGTVMTVGASLFLSLLGGVVCLLGGGLTALASVQKARRQEDEVILT